MTIWHKHQENNQVPDVDFLPCPWCGSDSISVETTLYKIEQFGDLWSAQASCHECGAQAPDSDFPNFKEHKLFADWFYADKEVEREVVNLAVKVWNARNQNLYGD